MTQPVPDHTFFAPAERASGKALSKDITLFRSLEYLSDILNALPYIAAILNGERQIVYSNKALIEMVGAASIDDVLGKRTGEALECVHASETSGGCGTSESCRFCGTMLAIDHCQRLEEKITHECRITAVHNGTTIAFDLDVTATPFRHNNIRYTIIALKDISDEKRRRTLEQVFFHDIINHAQSLTGLITFAKDITQTKEAEELLSLAHVASMELMDGILSQRDLLAAESGEVHPMKRTLSARMVIEECISLITHSIAAFDRQIVVDNPAFDCSIETDETLLKRILLNMIKNALEATPVKGSVVVGCERTERSVRFWAHNATSIPRAVALQIFQRSFSTKGSNRGLGTYSMKLLGEQFLGGKVYFTTNAESGTKFFLDLPA
jgi:K+-sensing histidine kinase KdpD